MTPVGPDRLAPLDETCGGLLPVLPAREDERSILEARDGVLGPWIARAELRARVLRLAKALAAPRKGVVFLLARNDVATVVAFLAARAARHAVALLDLKGAAEAHAALLDAYAPDFVLASDRPAFELGAATEVEGVSIWRRDQQAAAAPSADLALMLSTSGTTGSAKFVRLSDEGVLCNATQIGQALHIAPHDVGVGHLAFHYSYGFSVVSSHLAAGAAVAMIDDTIMSPTFWQTIGEAGGTHFPGVPFHYTALARFGVERMVPPSVTTFTQAGGALDMRFQTTLHEQASARGARFYVMYGQTEAGPRMTTLQSADFAAKSGSVGQALAGGQLSIVDAEGRPVPAGETGEVVYQGPNVMLGYASERADLVKGDEQAGRLVTGDLGYLDADGFLFLTGRSKRISKVFGLRISLDDVERRLGGGCAAVDAGERIVVFHEADAGPGPALGQLAEGLGLPSAAFRARAVEALPRMASGKTDYAALKEMI